MGYLSGINYITAVLIGLFAIPVLLGILIPLTGSKMQRTFDSLFNSLVFLASVVIAVYLEGMLLSNPMNPVLAFIHKTIPSIYSFMVSSNMWAELVIAVVLMAFVGTVLYLLTAPLRRFVFAPLAGRISEAVSRMNGVARRILGGMWELPKSVVLLLTFSLFLNIYLGYSSNAVLEKSADSSTPYQYIEKNILTPLQNLNLAKQIPVLLKDTFKQTSATLASRNIYLIRYFNGVTLAEAVKSDAAIDSAAKKIVGNETDDKQKAKRIYTWITKNVKYDDAKAHAVMSDNINVSSGAIVAYNTRSGICFDYSCLYIAMCRAVDIKVRFITGLGYSGAAWGDHAWNQIYDPNGARWINVDTTFGTSGQNYFDRTHFEEDHQDAVVQEEW